MKELGDNPTDEEIQDMINLVDENGDNEIDFDEFLTLMRLRMGDSGEDAEQNLRDVFDIFDADGSGYIDRNEMRVLMKKLAQDLTEEEITQIMEEVDQDGDDQISFEGKFQKRSLRQWLQRTHKHYLLNFWCRIPYACGMIRSPVEKYSGKSAKNQFIK